MADSILVDLSESIVAALITARDAGTFDTFDDFSITWDFEGRVKDSELSDDDLHVRVIVPRKYARVRPYDRAALEYIAAWDIDIRKRLGAITQDRNLDADRDICTQLSRLVEQIHGFFLTATDDGGALRRLTAGTLNGRWISEDEDIPEMSEILVAYSVKYLRDQRQFYGCCREVFCVS